MAASALQFRTTPNKVAGENYFNRIEVEGMDPNAVEKVGQAFVDEELHKLRVPRLSAGTTDRRIGARIGEGCLDGVAR